MSDLGFYAEREELPILRIVLLPFPVLLALALLGFARERRSSPARDAIALALLASLVVCLVFFVHARYRLTAVLAALLLAPGGVSALASLVRARGARMASAGLVCAALAAGIVWAQTSSEGPKERALGAFNEGLAYERLGDRTAAFVRFARAFAAAPGDRSVRNSYARALGSSGRIPEAEALLREGLAADPAATELRVSLGWLAFQQGSPSDAERHFREALRLDPTNASAKLSLAFARLEPA